MAGGNNRENGEGMSNGHQLSIQGELTLTSELVIHRTVRFSKSGDRRVLLTRRWVADERAPYVLFVMLNPSTANAVNDDPTMRMKTGDMNIDTTAT